MNETNRSSTSIFNLSFLDVFACVLGALILILIAAALQVANALTPEQVSRRLEASQETRERDIERIEQYRTIISLAEDWAGQAAGVEARIKELERLIESGQDVMKETDALEEDVREALRGLEPTDELRRRLSVQREVLAELERRLVIQREQNRGAVRFVSLNPTTAIPQEPRVLSVNAFGATDIKTGRKLTPGTREWEQFLEEMVRLRAREYVLLLVKPEGVEQYTRLEDSVRDRGLVYGFEPYTILWAPLYIGHGLSPNLD